MAVCPRVGCTLYTMLAWLFCLRITAGSKVEDTHRVENQHVLPIKQGLCILLARLCTDLSDALACVLLHAGCLVVPGLIDLHIHGYEHATPLGIDVDKYCLHRGVTTAVDAGRY